MPNIIECACNNITYARCCRANDMKKQVKGIFFGHKCDLNINNEFLKNILIRNLMCFDYDEPEKNCLEVGEIEDMITYVTENCSCECGK